jgi:hypothetical protein
MVPFYSGTPWRATLAGCQDAREALALLEGTANGSPAPGECVRGRTSDGLAVNWRKPGQALSCSGMLSCSGVPGTDFFPLLFARREARALLWRRASHGGHACAFDFVRKRVGKGRSLAEAATGIALRCRTPFSSQLALRVASLSCGRPRSGPPDIAEGDAGRGGTQFPASLRPWLGREGGSCHAASRRPFVPG